MHRLASQGHQVTVAIATRGWPPLFPEEQVQRVRAESRAANDVLGVSKVEYMDLPVTKLQAMPKHEINAAFDRLIVAEQPNWVFLPFPGDRHEDHKQVFEAAMVALRPLVNRPAVDRILCYETVSETHWAAGYIETAFEPQIWVDIAADLGMKLKAMEQYASQLRSAPDARSLEAIRALATWRGSVVGMEAAEAFVLARECWRSDARIGN